MGHSTCQNIIVVFFKNTHIMLNANVDGPIDRLGGVVQLRIDDRLEPLPENRPSLSEPPDAEIEISPSKVGMVDLYIATGKMELGVHAGRKYAPIDRSAADDGRSYVLFPFLRGVNKDRSTWAIQHVKI